MQAKITEKPERFGFRLRAFRNQRNFTQSDLGKAVDRTGTSISEWEKGESEPTLAQIVAMAAILKTTPERLAFGSFSPEADISPAEVEIIKEFEHLLDLAAGDAGRLGWIQEQLREYLSPPARWENAHAKAVASVLANEAAAAAKEETPKPSIRRGRYIA